MRNETSGECVEWREFDEKKLKLVEGSGGCVEEMDGILPEVEGGGKNDNRDVGTRWNPTPVLTGVLSEAGSSLLSVGASKV